MFVYFVSTEKTEDDESSPFVCCYWVLTTNTERACESWVGRVGGGGETLIDSRVLSHVVQTLAIRHRFPVWKWEDVGEREAGGRGEV